MFLLSNTKGTPSAIGDPVRLLYSLRPSRNQMSTKKASEQKSQRPAYANLAERVMGTFMKPQQLAKPVRKPTVYAITDIGIGFYQHFYSMGTFPILFDADDNPECVFDSRQKPDDLVYRHWRNKGVGQLLAFLRSSPFPQTRAAIHGAMSDTGGYGGDGSAESKEMCRQTNKLHKLVAVHLDWFIEKAISRRFVSAANSVASNPSSVKDQKAALGESQCVVCLDRRAIVANKNCAHVSMCMDCVDSAVERSPMSAVSCPICRNEMAQLSVAII